MLNWVFIALASCLLGSLPSGLIVGRVFRNTDIRERGSGNAGTTNAFRLLGWKLGLLVAVMDVGKGYLAVAGIPSLAPFRKRAGRLPSRSSWPPSPRSWGT
jgi:acyl phosphate:glycerol-3-phosphate acyltransferase